MYGTCAGMIMLADKILDPRSGQETVGGIDMIVRRNAFGRQNESFEAGLEKTVRWYIDNRGWWERIGQRGYRGERLGLAAGV